MFRRIFFTILTLFFAGSTPAGFLHAQPLPDSCDADYFDVLRARSYLEGKREMDAAQRIILKADSVLEYSCFYIDVDFVGNWGATFSENGLVGAGGNPPEFDGGIGIFGGSLDSALGHVVETSLVGFMESFSHIYGGGTYTVPALGALCNPMNVVWAASKCANFDPNWWVRLGRLPARDIRTLPDPCSEPDRATTIRAALDASYPDPQPVAASGGMDAVNSFLGHISGGCSTPESRDAISTGIRGIYSNGTMVDEAICINPRCSYNGTRCVGY